MLSSWFWSHLSQSKNFPESSKRIQVVLESKIVVQQFSRALWNVSKYLVQFQKHPKQKHEIALLKNILVVNTLWLEGGSKWYFSGNLG